MMEMFGTRIHACAPLVLCAGAALAGCAGNGEGLDASGRPVGEGGGGTPPPPSTQASFQQIQDTIFTPICTACHAGAAAPLGLRLDAGNSYALLVNVPSVEAPAILRVTPGDPDNSYLVQKIEGSASVGARMPLGGPPLPQSSIDLVRAWIAEGAPAPAGASGTADVFRVVTTIPAADAQVVAPVEALHVIFNADVDATLVGAAGIRIEASGGDGVFDNGNEVRVPLADVRVSAVNPRMLTVRPVAPLSGDRFRLVLGASAGIALADVGAHVLDGDADGRAGGEFSVTLDTVPERAP